MFKNNCVHGRPAHLSLTPLLVVLVLVNVSCSTPLSFDPMVEFEGDTVSLDMDLTDAPVEGIVIPSTRQTSTGYFHFSALVAPESSPLYYKIYYQNTSYAFPLDDSLCYENFYGSWEEVAVGFKEVPSDGAILDSFRIVGNPRDEQIYYGVDLSSNPVSADAILQARRAIESDTHWYGDVCRKAAQNGTTIDQQLFLDAQWVVNDARHRQGDVNHRWKRNPRTGCYEFLLVVADEQGLAMIPDEVQHIDKNDEGGRFVNPFQWFEQHPSRHLRLFHGSKILRTRAVLNPRAGLFVDEAAIRRADYTIDNTASTCGTSDSLYRHAHFQQFFPAVSQQYTLRNIPLVRDIKDYTMADYQAASTRYSAEQLLPDYPQITRCPCSTVCLEEDGITLINPGNEGLEHPKKESTGIKSRVGFTYGRYRGRIKFPPMLNDEHLWNGLTYAFWLIYQDEHPWNQRRASYHGGYIEKNDDSPNPVRHTTLNYSEIDIEIVKASRNWPAQYYRQPPADDHAAHNDEVMFCCTNWDLASPEPAQFASGISSLKLPRTLAHSQNAAPHGRGASYEAMRWSDHYKALTIKTPISNAIFSEKEYCYEIEWRPTEIIWRLGPDPQHMRVVGYMDSRHTMIPNNQMLCVVTQEYHYSEWWPPIVFQQGLIPFNASDIEGKVYDVVIE